MILSKLLQAALCQRLIRRSLTLVLNGYHYYSKQHFGFVLEYGETQINNAMENN